MSKPANPDKIIKNTTVYKTFIVKDPLSENFGYDFTIISKEPGGSWFLSDIIGVDMFLASIRSSMKTPEQQANVAKEQQPKNNKPYQNVIKMTHQISNNLYNRKQK